MQIIRLEDYRAVAPAQPLRLGSWDSYGIETLQIQPGAGWQGLELVATFVTPDGATQVPVPPDGVLTVPPEATARPLPADQPGRLVFAGMAEGVRRVSTNLAFVVSDHAPADGAQSRPTPSLWEQYFDKVQGMIDRAVPPAGEVGAVLTRTKTGTAWQKNAGYTVGAGLKLDPETNTLSVDVAGQVQQDNTRPITSAAVYTAVGNIDALLQTI